MADTTRPVRHAVAAGLTAALVLLGSAAAAAAPAGVSDDPTGLETGGTVGGAGLSGSGLLVDPPAGVPAPPAPTSAAWLLADLDSGDVLAASAPHTRLAPASTLKLLTALALVPRIPAGAVHTATDADANIDGSKVGLVPGSKYTRADLLAGLMLGSGNDCANALAELAGGQAEATAAMNETARSLGARDTVAGTPSGLDAAGQSSSAYDLALVARAALADRTVGGAMGTVRYRFPAGGAALDGSRKRFEIQNHNKLLWNYAGATGGKTGYTIAARHSFVGSAERGGRRYVVTILKGEGQAWKQAGALLDWAFAQGERVTPVGTLVTPEQVAQAEAPPQQANSPAGAARSAALPEAAPGEGTSFPGGILAVLVGGGVVVAAAASTGLLGVRRWGGPVRHRRL